MKRKQMLFGMAAALCVMSCTAAAQEKEVLETVILQIEDEEPIEIANTAQLDIQAVSVEKQEDGTLHVTMDAKDGQEYEFVDVKYDQMADPELIVEGDYAFIKYTSLTSGKERTIAQTGEKTYEEPVELFAVDDVYIRSEPSDEGEILGVINRGDAIEVLGETATHYQVKKGDVTGYTVRKCISEDEQEALAAVKAEEAAQASLRAAEAAQQSAPQQSSVYEVKRQRFDDCDGSGHGYYKITYSDGSTAIEEY